MDLNEYSIDYDEGWDENFKDFDLSTKSVITKKIQQLKQPLKHRHLKRGLPFFVVEVVGYRITFQIDEEKKTKTIRFVGDHKQYEKWY